MLPLGLGALFIGLWFVESGLKNRKPLATLAAILANPKNARKTTAGAEGSNPIGTYETSGATYTSTGGNWDGSGAPAVSGVAATVIAFARAQIGKPYVWGATGPSSYDCSGLVVASFKAAGISLPRTTYQQVLMGTAVSRAELIPGDLVFPDPGHVGIYTGNGMWIEAPHAGTSVREVQDWGFWRARRINTSGAPFTSAGGDWGASNTDKYVPTQRGPR